MSPLTRLHDLRDHLVQRLPGALAPRPRRRLAHARKLARHGAPSLEIARRTRVPREVITLAIFAEMAARPEESSGTGTICRAQAGGGWSARASN